MKISCVELFWNFLDKTKLQIGAVRQIFFSKDRDEPARYLLVYYIRPTWGFFMKQDGISRIPKYQMTV